MTISLQILLTLRVAAQTYLESSVSPEVATQLREWEQHLAAGRWEAALDRLSSLATGSEGLVETVQANREFRRGIPLRSYLGETCAIYGVKSPEFLQAYRRRFPDGLVARPAPSLRLPSSLAPSGGAQAWLDLTRIESVQNAAASALVDGQFDAARRMWQSTCLASQVPAGDPWEGGSWWWLPSNRHTNSLAAFQTSVQSLAQGSVKAAEYAQIWANLILTSAWQGDLERARWELQCLETWQPNVEGEMGGRRGVLVEMLRQELQAETERRRVPTPGPPAAWPTLGASSMRTHQVEGLDASLAQWQLGSHWTCRLQATTAPQRTEVAPDQWRVEAPDYPWFPVITANGLVAWHDQRRLYVRDVHTGEPAWEDSARGTALAGLPAPPPFSLLSDRPATPCTMTVHGEQAFAYVPSSAQPGESGFIVGLDLTRKGAALAGFPWPVPGPAWSYAGTPITDGRHLFYALWKHDAVTELHVACRELTSSRVTWQRQVCLAPGIRRQHAPEVLLTRHDDRIIVNSNCGVVAAVTSHTGQPEWWHTYPRGAEWSVAQLQRARPQQPQLSPSVTYRELVITLPYDSEHLFALDQATGRFRWAYQLPQRQNSGVYLLGVVDDTVVVAGTHLWRIDLRSGKPREGGGENPYPDMELAMRWGSGRGLLGDTDLLWPVLRDNGPELLRIPARTGHIRQTALPLWYSSSEGGNLIAAHGMLLLAGRESLHAWSITTPTLAR